MTNYAYHHCFIIYIIINFKICLYLCETSKKLMKMLNLINLDKLKTFYKNLPLFLFFLSKNYFE